ncbi:MAG: hypothetical protein II678_03285, partial [Erysipelotrichaceae bacterium]|nr:hypothetical protein [Erysipelotrichaceae bacterium]
CGRSIKSLPIVQAKEKTTLRGTLRKEGASVVLFEPVFQLTDPNRCCKLRIALSLRGAKRRGNPYSPVKKLRKTDSHVTGVRTGSSECQAKRIIICCALDFVGQNPMLAITVDNERPVR